MHAIPHSIATLAQIAALAVEHRHADAAVAVYRGIVAARPDDHRAQAGLAFALIGSGDYREAAELFRLVVLPAEPDNPLMRCFHGYALQKSGRIEEGENILKDYLRAAQPDCRAVAEACLGGV